MADFNITNKIRIAPADNSQWCFNFSDENDALAAYALCVDLNEGISIPFKAAITVLCKEKVSREKLYKLLGQKVEFSLVQEETSTVAAVLKRVRRYEGIVTSAAFGGRVLTVGDEPSDKINCFRYELCIEPEMIKMGFVRKIRNWSSEYNIASILKTIFNDYNMEVAIPESMFSQGEENYALLKNSGFVFEQNETDLDFINRLCKNFSLNYTFAYEEETHNPPKYLVHFSRSFITLPNLPVYTDENLFVHAATSDGRNIVFNTEITRFLDHSFSKNTVFSANFEEVLNESCLNNDDSNLMQPESGYEDGDDNDALGIANKLLEEYRRSSAAKTSINRRSRCLISAANLLYVPGSMLTVREDETDSSGADDKWVVVREIMRFNSNYPKKVFGYSDTLAADEGKVRQNLACIAHVINDSDRLDTLGAMGVFDRLKWETTLPQTLTLTDDSHEKTLTSEVPDDNLSVTKGVVCDKNGNTDKDQAKSDEIIPDDANLFYPNKFYFKPAGTNAVLVAEYVSDSNFEDYANSIPKIGSHVLVMKTDNEYFFMGYMYSTPGIDSNAINLITEKPVSSSLSINNENSLEIDIGLNGIEVSDYSSSAARIKDAIMKGTLSLGIITPLGNIDNTTGYWNYFVSEEYTLNLKNITEKEGKGTISDDSKTDNIRNCTLKIVEKIKEDRQKAAEHAAAVRNKKNENQNTEDEENLYNLYMDSLNNDMTVLNGLSKAILDKINDIKTKLGLEEF